MMTVLLLLLLLIKQSTSKHWLINERESMSTVALRIFKAASSHFLIKRYSDSTQAASVTDAATLAAEKDAAALEAAAAAAQKVFSESESNALHTQPAANIVLNGIEQQQL